MDAIYLLIFMGAVVAVGFLIAFFISVKNGQFDDNETPAMRILFDDGIKEKEKSEDVEKKGEEEGKRE
ncbi:MAG TPA: cbb3-type cytochrome oxidase assembly protein CcoS [Bacteroidetes bacterium]|nr:cbb3-type cytochrome oxidase assembly protein CcoS [Bacteroidota bacterium]